ncbi:uncharacterized protein KNAG_0F01860 [Huiozyma naganishii CBS 8797]|uniref:Hyphally-regulated cell wall protein N-terminal domain-containing protein n=1 Tax=Huiozyma naganishii (strain ATCC MYA-139 / BCRC 22969 / CBS 8797 / KCTC 17520 / NBRC 10181 / NCYC 3082 / Yp74L-3) TaxID=1071383 RepID=J7S799_HUIN7|nr:hypothetical protein KNAG_0F01860 [Kazachstania naganishii CBS 8797]CCK70854.1 hypothetical protein KNAG_0F01860 [Kazachstania naganishii CBS 8797]
MLRNFRIVLLATISLLCAALAQIVTDGLVVTDNVTLSGDRVFNGNVTVEKGASLTLTGGCYTFDNDVNIYGNLVVELGECNEGLFDATASSVNITGTVELYSSGAAHLDSKAFLNLGHIYLRHSEGPDSNVWWIIQVSQSFLNKGTIYMENDNRLSSMEVDILNPNGVPIVNDGLISVKGQSQAFNSTTINTDGIQLFTVQGKLQGSGTMEITNGFLGLSSSQYLEQQNIVLKGSILFMVAYESSSAFVRGLSDSIIVFNDPAVLDFSATVQDGKVSIEIPNSVYTITDLDNMVTTCDLIKKTFIYSSQGTSSLLHGLQFNGPFSPIPEPKTTTEVVGGTMGVEYVTSYSRIEENGTCGFGSTVYSRTFSTFISVNPSSHHSSSVSSSASQSSRTSLVSSRASTGFSRSSSSQPSSRSGSDELSKPAGVSGSISAASSSIESDRRSINSGYSSSTVSVTSSAEKTVSTGEMQTEHPTEKSRTDSLPKTATENTMFLHVLKTVGHILQVRQTI